MSPNRVKSFRFFVLSDLHYGATYCDERNKMLKGRLALMNEENKREYNLILGDLTDNDHYDEYHHKYKDDWCPNSKEIPIFCSGYGNHDVNGPFGNKADVMDRIGDENREFRRDSKSFKNFTMCDKHLHYAWDYPDDERIHFIMLNLCPTMESQRLHHRNASRNALVFLEKTLKKISKKHPIFLFHHYGFDNCSLGKCDNEYWWTQEERDIYIESINGWNIAAFFTGHIHDKAKNYIPQRLVKKISDGRIVEEIIPDERLNRQYKDRFFNSGFTVAKNELYENNVVFNIHLDVAVEIRDNNEMCVRVDSVSHYTFENTQTQKREIRDHVEAAGPQLIIPMG